MTIFEKTIRIILLIVGVCGLAITVYNTFGVEHGVKIYITGATVSIYLVSLNPWSIEKKRARNNTTTIMRSFIATLLFFIISMSVGHLFRMEGYAVTEEIFIDIIIIIILVSPIISWYLVDWIMENILINRYTLLSLIIAVSATIMFASSKKEGNFIECGIGSVWENKYMNAYDIKEGDCIPASGILLKVSGIFFIFFYLTFFLLSSAHGAPRILNNRKKKEKKDDEVKKIAEAIVLADKMKKEKVEE